MVEGGGARAKMALFLYSMYSYYVYRSYCTLKDIKNMKRTGGSKSAGVGYEGGGGGGGRYFKQIFSGPPDVEKHP